ncbi:MAG: hypothetical protein AABY22_19045 [Nanoarchaeota archaeon]
MIDDKTNMLALDKMETTEKKIENEAPPTGGVVAPPPTNISISPPDKKMPNLNLQSCRESFKKSPYSQLSPIDKKILEFYFNSQMNLSKTAKLINEEFKHLNLQWDHQHIRFKLKGKLRPFVLEKLQVEGFTPDKWELMGLEVLEGEREFDSAQVEVWKTFGKVKHLYEDNKNHIQIQSIDVTQMDGR